MGVVEPSRRVQPLLELLEGQRQRAEPPRLEQLHHQLVLAALRIALDGPEGEHVQAVGGLEADPTDPVAEQYGAELRALVLEREVGVARAVDLEVADLALDPHGREPLFERRGQPPRELGDAPDRALAHDAVSPRPRSAARRPPPSDRSAASSVVLRSIATVSRPTPPGTGVTPPARWATDSKSTSPARVPVSRRLTPTSITHAPSFTMSPVIMRGRPAATQSTSARRVGSAGARRPAGRVVTGAWR